ncbi:MAG: hypothetical protein IPM98_22345 [Lewinellaceae bacterium]|nr:hypothetical protein [Lewinellaceae bacterium]
MLQPFYARFQVRAALAPRIPALVMPGIRFGLVSKPNWNANRPIAVQFILTLVRGHCGQDLDCLRRNYYNIMIRLEQQFNLPAAIDVCKEMVQVARMQKDLKEEGGSNMNLSRYYSALGMNRLATVYIDKALALFDQSGHYFPQVEARMSKLELSVKDRKLGDVLADMDVLLAEAEGKGDSLAIYHLNARMLRLKIDAGRYEEAYKHIAVIEKCRWPIQSGLLF